jgi:AcrR family transcriptional regulator
VTTVPQRKDAARNWHRILEVGRRHLDEGVPIQLNEVARAASVGVATVYRHFPTPEALVETVATPGLEALEKHAEQAMAAGDPWTGLRDFLFAAVDAQMTDAAHPAVFAAAADALPRTTELKQRLYRLSGTLLDRAQAAGAADPQLTPTDIAPLLCGVTYAASMHPLEQRAATARRYLAVLLEGLHTRSA